jgi:hypothetical protein
MSATQPIPRLPIFGWQAFQGPREAAMPCMLSLPGMHYTTSGRASILLALETLGVGAGDAVLLPSYHCPTMVAPASGRGAVPRFYPIDAQGTPRLEWLDQQNLGGVRAMLVAHFFGLPQPMAAVRAWCEKRGIALIEDCAHAMFGRSGERAIGAWGDIAIGSLTKFLPVPEGGCMVLNNGGTPPPLQPCGNGDQLRAAVDILEVGAAQGSLTGFNGLISGALGALRRLRPAVAAATPPAPQPAAADEGRNELTANDQRIDSVMAHRQLSSASGWVARTMPRHRIVERRRRHYGELGERLSGHAGLRPLLPGLPVDCAPYVFPLWVDRPDPGYAELRRLRMPVFRWNRLWPSVTRMPGDHGLDWSHHVLQLGCHQDLTRQDIDRFVQTVLALYAS